MAPTFSATRTTLTLTLTLALNPNPNPNPNPNLNPNSKPNPIYRYAVHNLPYTTDARVPNGLLDVIRGTALSTCSTFPSTFPFAPAASESLPWYNGLHLEPVPEPDQYHKGERKGERPEDFPELSSPSEETASSAVSSSSSEAGG